MEHTVTAPHAGIVERLPFALADRVAAGSVLVELKAAPRPRALSRRQLVAAGRRGCCAASAKAGSVTLNRVSWPSRLASATLPPASCT